MAMHTRGREPASVDDAGGEAAWQAVILELDAEGQVAAIADSVVAAIATQQPELAADHDLAISTRATVEADMHLFVHVVRTGASTLDVEPTPSGAAAVRKLARRGIPVSVVIRAYQTAQYTAWRWALARLKERIREPADVAAAVEGMAEAMVSFAATLVWRMSEIHADERERWVRDAAAVRAETITTMLNGGSVSAQAARQLGYPLEREHVGFVVWTSDESVEVELETEGARVADALGGSEPLLTSTSAQTLWGWVGFASTPPPGFTDSLAPSTQALSVAVGSPHDGIEGFRRTHAEALAAQRLAGIARRHGPGVIAYPDVALAAMMTRDLSQARAFVSRELGALAAGDSQTRTLARTLAVYLEEASSPRRAARRLGVHENTVANRVRAAAELLDHPLDRRVPETLAALRIAGFIAVQR